MDSKDNSGFGPFDMLLVLRIPGVYPEPADGGTPSRS